jgi:SAM-dependent methyltransferase
MIFIHPQPSSDEIRQMYSKEYFEGDFRCGHAGSYFDEGSLEHLVDTGLLRRIKHYKPSGSFLEIGCAGGAFLDAARKEGYDVAGVEFSEDASAIARTKFNLNVFTGDVSDAKFADNTFDIVFMGDVLEHLPNPVKTIKEIHRITAPKGMLVLLVPSQTNTIFSRVGFLAYNLLGKNAVVNLPPYHLFEYRSHSMEELLRRCGFASVRKIESLIPPSNVTLRGSMAQRTGKKVFQYPNYILTKLFGIFGDRLDVYAVKQ